jgi:uncharacterized lipoprotein YddW (UPF0748 family)
VSNIDWPSKPGLSTAQQQKEILAILDRAAELKLNAIILQVRTSCDALYPSALEPWSEYLTGRQGQPPEPFYDPLKLWIDEAHQRGIELHAWFNPYRARVSSAKTPDASTHISNTHPEVVKKFNGWEWLDPGEKLAQERTLAVFLDVVKRYDIDGVHMDDYFYPYPSYLKEADFPDGPSWQKYVASGGKLGRADWRRQNVNHLIEAIYREIKHEKPWVKFGISPFGIWKPGHPSMVRGFNQYESLYADAKLWLNAGWCDYFTPQIYWKISATSQPYPDLLTWWIDQNWRQRHIWPGNFTSRVGDKTRYWEPQEILDQIAVTRNRPGASGNVHFSMKALLQNREGLSDALKAGPYAQPALVPASTWLDSRPPRAPRLKLGGESDRQNVSISWEANGREPVWLWAVYARYGQTWRLQILPAAQTQCILTNDPALGRLKSIAIAAIDRCGNESPRAIRNR